MVPIGGMPPARAAIKTHQIDGYIGALETGYMLEEAKEWRVITAATPFVDHFITHVLFARDELIAKHPDTVRAFLKGWFETIAFMKANKDKVGRDFRQGDQRQPRRSRRASMTSRSAASRPTARSIRRAVATLKKSFIEMDLLKGRSARQRPVHDAVRAGESRLMSRI